MAQFRAKKLDLGCFINIKNIRDHTKRKVFQDNEPERFAHLQWLQSLSSTLKRVEDSAANGSCAPDKPSATQSATPPSPNEPALKRN
ncbi:hypothetical protein LTR09_009631 [Extremus antarcticus]|uniref:Uncharacterized protein n=1 Tax=Extremus antarcticus TaxID=702011 RepID=A0AAJ0G5H9_9PEZI|nr:hypothetical protein LTR09_009631 [Extremus antarcticus]